jgi:hypothetical protein
MENYPSSFHFPVWAIVLYVALIILMLAAYWKIFTKAGKPGWAGIIPIYNAIVLLEIVGKPVWWFLLFFIPCVNIVFLIWTINLLSKSFGKGTGFTIGLILLGPIFICILAFGDAVYVGPAAAEANAANRFGSGDYQKPSDI